MYEIHQKFSVGGVVVRTLRFYSTASRPHGKTQEKPQGFPSFSDKYLFFIFEEVLSWLQSFSLCKKQTRVDEGLYGEIGMCRCFCSLRV